jgi:DNA-directed RNA polymerase specialized sigma24 family protein
MNREQELLKRVVAGLPKADEEFMALFRPRLLRTCAFLFGDAEAEAEEVIQETFRFALPRLRHVANTQVYAWLRQTCLRFCYIRLSGQARIPANPNPDGGLSPGPDETETQR